MQGCPYCGNDSFHNHWGDGCNAKCTACHRPFIFRLSQPSLPKPTTWSAAGSSGRIFVTEEQMKELLDKSPEFVTGPFPAMKGRDELKELLDKQERGSTGSSPAQSKD